MTTVSVFGGTGFLGRRLVRRLAAEGTAVRVAVTPSPEPLSNFALSVGEDLLAVLISWLAGRHPYWAAAIAALLLTIIVVLARAVLRTIRAAFARAGRQLALLSGSRA